MTTAGTRKAVAAAVAVGTPGIITLLAFADTDAIIPALLYVLAVASAAAAGGIWAGILASVCSFIPYNYFWTGSPHGFGFSHADDLVGAAVFLATALGVGSIIDREQRALAAARTSARTGSRLQVAAESLSRAVSPDDVLDAVLTAGVEAASARAGMIAVLSEDGKELVPIAWRGYRSGLAEQWSRFPVAADYPLSEAVRSGQPVFLTSRDERLQRYPALETGPEPTFGLVCLPLIVEEETIGGLVFSFDSDQEYDEERRGLKMALARQAAQALQRARMYEAIRLAEGRVSFLAEASELLSRSLDYRDQMPRLAGIAVPRLADWCVVDVLDESGEIERVAVAHKDPEKTKWGWELQRRFPARKDDPSGVARVLRTGEPELLPEIPPEALEAAIAERPELADVIEKLGARSWLCVPLKGHDRVLGAITLVTADSGRTFTQADLALATALAGRASVAIENALLYREAERRGDAARALTYVGDAVVLVDRNQVIRYWNRAAEALLEVPEGWAHGAAADDVVPGWETIAALAEPAEEGTGKVARSVTVPIVISGHERWFSVAAVDFGEGCVYALRDRTDEHALEQARTDFVATASHELRTPLAAVYGSVRTLRRRDEQVSAGDRELLLEVIERETGRLTAIVEQILVADQLGSDALPVGAEPCDLRSLADEVISAARVRAPDGIAVELEAPSELPPVRADGDKLRQVLVNLVENAIKYSPDGGSIVVRLDADNGTGRIAVSDPGIGIPMGDQQRIFEKFTRLDPGLTRGVGGTGLGLYITRELITRMGGTISVSSAPGRGSTFTVELPVES